MLAARTTIAHWDKKSGGRGGPGYWQDSGHRRSAAQGQCRRSRSENVTAEAADGFVREVVSNKVSLLATDDWSGYERLKKEFPRDCRSLQRPIRGRRGPHQHD